MSAIVNLVQRCRHFTPHHRPRCSTRPQDCFLQRRVVLLPLLPVCLLVAAAVFGQFNLEVGVATLLLSSTVAAARPTTALGSLLSRSVFFFFFFFRGQQESAEQKARQKHDVRRLWRQGGGM